MVRMNGNQTLHKKSGFVLAESLAMELNINKQKFIFAYLKKTLIIFWIISAVCFYFV
jgi:hypothetical protein